MHLLLLTTLAYAFDDWEYTANELRVPSAAQAPVAFVGTVKSWKPVYLAPHMKSAREPDGPCNTEYVFTVNEVVRGPVLAGSEFTLLWSGGCKLKDGRVTSGVATSPHPPPAGVKLLLFVRPVDTLGYDVPMSESMFWTNEYGGVHRVSGGRWSVDGRPVPDGDPVVYVGGLLAVKPGPHQTHGDPEAALAPYAGGRPVTVPELTAAIRSGRIDGVAGDE